MQNLSPKEQLIALINTLTHNLESKASSWNKRRLKTLSTKLTESLHSKKSNPTKIHRKYLSFLTKINELLKKANLSKQKQEESEEAITTMNNLEQTVIQEEAKSLASPTRRQFLKAAGLVGVASLASGLASRALAKERKFTCHILIDWTQRIRKEKFKPHIMKYLVNFLENSNQQIFVYILKYGSSANPELVYGESLLNSLKSKHKLTRIGKIKKELGTSVPMGSGNTYSGLIFLLNEIKKRKEEEDSEILYLGCRPHPLTYGPDPVSLVREQEHLDPEKIRGKPIEEVLDATKIRFRDQSDVINASAFTPMFGSKKKKIPISVVEFCKGGIYHVLYYNPITHATGGKYERIRVD